MIVSILMYKYEFICMYSYLINMKILNFKDFIKKHNLKNDTMNESQCERNTHKESLYLSYLS